MPARYDYIIAGGGSAGCVLAARLSEDRDVSVLLIEAGGGDAHPLFHIPAGFARMTRGIASWGWSTVPQKHMKDRVFRFTQAKVLGGGSTINAQVYVRGNDRDYDLWAQSGCRGWSYRDVLPYFRRAEGNSRLDDEFHSTDGPLGVGDPVATLPICEAFFAAAGEAGIPRNPDFNGARQEGVGFYQVTQKNVRRSSTVTAYLKPARGRTNLTVIRDAPVLRVLVEKGRAIGVEIASPSEGREVLHADREVIVSSGTIGSPRLLMLSGIGPADHLKSLGIAPVCDAKSVGSNLQDHLDLCVICECTGDHTYDKYAKPHWAALAGARYALFRDGPAASSLFVTGGFWYADAAAERPDTQFHLGFGSGIEAGIAKLENAGVTLNSAFMRPRSRGTVRLASADPLAAPLIDPNYWSDPYDREMSIRGLRLAREIMRKPALKPFVLAERVPGPDVATDAQLADYACTSAKTDHHPVGTCRMGTDEEAVVNPDLTFRDIDALRIVDASIMPNVITGNTNAATIMIAEKAADIIRGRAPLAVN
ncbi:alanine-phosphoribitol ligase [Nordella sp. HKS 07]|uniref:GMC family oxidoreductase n=1 Tax=Nordella sp. HKS 07 TaxID=2712222 RepID=UPI0013E13AF6|nr:GMC family oxidoreductase N-terminal domain-containing protein [Nordella sp. HKS 07]QIG48609.1 alanine-phosphoribitol ligase [Nordella sp. HKS 07]